VLTYAGVCAAALAGRRNGATAHATFRIWLCPWTPILGLAACAGILGASWFDVDKGRPSLIANFACIGLSLVYYTFFLRGGWVVRDPEPDVPE
jgi:L-asparagine transporter-like permease